MIQRSLLQSSSETQRQPLVTVITVSYNAVKTIEQTMLSVLNQTYPNIEYIIIDGGSTDGTVDIIKKYADRLAYWVSEPDKGIYDAMNKGIDKATGVLIGIINSDDWYELDCVENVVLENKKDENAVIYGILRTIENEIPWELYSCYPNTFSTKMLPHPTCFVPKTIYNKYGAFDLNYKSSADYQLVLRFYMEKVRFVMVEKVLANFRVGGYSDTLKSKIESFDMRYKMKQLSYRDKMIKSIGLYLKYKLFQKK